MRVETADGPVDLTYCTNIHAGETWDDIRASLAGHLPEIRAAVAPGARMGVGLRLSAIAAETLAAPAALDEFRGYLDDNDLYVFTINAFPYGPFHGRRVKEDVYQPDWSRPERLVFADRAAEILAALVPAGGFGSVSTVPGTFKALATEDRVDAIVEGYLAHAARLVALERATGRHIALAIEPEPCCFLETAEEAIGFFEGRLLAPAGLRRMAALCGVDDAAAERLIRRHVGLCYDVCHGAVEFEDPVAALDDLAAAGISVPKIQLSCALEVPRTDDAALAALKRFDDGVYLHQTVVRADDRLTRHADLAPAFAARADAGGAPSEVWRVHCHVPIFQDGFGLLDSTRPDLLAVLETLRRRHLSPHLEVETYTWDVLPDELRGMSKSEGIARELAFVRERLG